MSADIRILIADGFAQNGLDLLKQMPSLKIDLRKSIDSSELLRIIPEYEVLIVRSATQVTSAVLDAGKSLRLLLRAGAGVDNIDVVAASNKKIPVMNTATANSLAAAEQTIALLFAMFREIPQASRSLAEGRWDRDLYKGREVTGKTLGLIGLGNIGSIVAKKALGLEMRVIGYDPLASTPPGVQQVGSVSEVLRSCDVLSLHVPKSKKGYLIGREEIRQMRPGSSLIHCARGGVVDESAVLEALDSGALSGAAFDVFEEEPPRKDHPLLTHPLVVATPHLGASTLEAQERVASTGAQQIIGYFQRGEKQGIVNLESLGG